MTLVQQLNDEADKYEAEMRFEVPPLRDLIRLLRDSAVALAKKESALVRISNLEDSESDEPLDDAIGIARSALDQKE